MLCLEVIPSALVYLKQILPVREAVFDNDIPLGSFVLCLHTITFRSSKRDLAGHTSKAGDVKEVIERPICV